MSFAAESTKALDGQGFQGMTMRPGSRNKNCYTFPRSQSLGRKQKDDEPPPLKRPMIQANISTQNSYESLDDDMGDNNINNPAENSHSFRPKLNNPSDKVQTKSKPVIVCNTTNELMQRYMQELGIKSPLSKLGRASYRIQPNNLVEKKKLCDKLAALNIEYHTYTEANERKAMYVLKGLDRLEPEIVQKMLTDEKIDVNKVTFLIDNDNYPSYLVSFNKGSTTIGQLVNQHSIINFTRVKWEKLEERTRRPTQCKRCQAWGHAASNCNRKYRCVKCLEDHEPNCCKRTKEDITKNSPPSCVNCGKVGHLSSSYDCPSFKNYDEKIQRRRPARLPRKFDAAPAQVWNNQAYYNAAFPRLETSSRPPPETSSRSLNNNNRNVNRPSTSQTLHSERKSNFDNFEDIQKEFNDIPGLDEAFAILRDLAGELKNQTNNHGRAIVIFKFLNLDNGY
jgi:hypothetical protein